ncbi:MAG: aldo/keto reductase [Candidatus Promineifilaceae bacterium]
MSKIEQIPFGRTGHESTRLLLGAAAFAGVSQAEADAALELAFSYGINHVDTAASYGDSELRIGDWIRRHGRPFFLATKTEKRTAVEAYQEIRRSLERLQVDQVDLIQLHFLVDPDEWNLAMGPGGALEAAIAARNEGLVRFIGVTGHGWTVAERHLAALQRFDFDSILLPYSYTMMQNESYAQEFETLVAVCQERNVAVQTIKSLVHRPWQEGEQSRATWYKPLEDQQAIDTAVQWVLGRPGLFLNTVGDVNILPRMLDAAARYESPPSDEDMAAVVRQLQMAPLFA